MNQTLLDNKKINMKFKVHNYIANKTLTLIFNQDQHYLK